MGEKLSDQADGHSREVMEQLFNDLYTANSPYLSIYNLAKHRTGDEQQARDITMMIFQAPHGIFSRLRVKPSKLRKLTSTPFALRFRLSLLRS